MIIRLSTPGRAYRVGQRNEIEISDVGTVQLDHDEQITFVDERGCKVDFARKAWGYMLPSVDPRLATQGIRVAKLWHPLNRVYPVVVLPGTEAELKDYLAAQKMCVLEWIGGEHGNI